MGNAAVIALSAPRVRGLLPDDVRFVAATWKQNFKFDSPWAKHVKHQLFLAEHGPIIDKLIETSRVLIACDPEDESEILGDLVCEPDALHWAFTKPPFRRCGVFRALLSASGLPAKLEGITVTHGTKHWFGTSDFVDRETGETLKAGKPGLSAKYPAAIYNPYRIFKGQT